MTNDTIQPTIYKGRRIKYLSGTVKGKKIVQANWTSQFTGEVFGQVGNSKQEVLTIAQGIIDRDIKRLLSIRRRNRAVQRRRRRIIQGKTPLVPSRFRLSGGYGAGTVRAEEDMIFELGGRF